MKSAKYIACGVICISLQGASLSWADDPAQPTETATAHGQPGGTGRDAQGAEYREQLQERIRNMSPAEQAIMRDTSVNGRARLESRQAENQQGMQRRGGSGGGYGQGYGSRRGGGGSGRMGGSAGGW